VCLEIHTARSPKIDREPGETNTVRVRRTEMNNAFDGCSLSTIAALYYMLTLCSWWRQSNHWPPSAWLSFFTALHWMQSGL